MGIPTDPSDFEYGIDCGSFPAGKTPKYMYVYLMDMKFGKWAGPGTTPPPNGRWKLTQGPGACIWKAAASDFELYLEYYMDTTLFFMTYEWWSGWVFWSGSIDAIVWAFPNLQDDWNIELYYGGRAQVAFKEAGGSPSLYSKAQLLNIQGDSEIKAEFFPIDDNEFICQYANARDGTNIRIRVDTD